ncbi:hypothetical protein SUGI_0073630 [Cryptomeria japonica]|uniref:scopoletin glucosyltransferase-like n=1 Tax=Cryptomeria japonica TaxID=3369 RepID=UPI002408D99E|nr:scopoletin glucosyltransferase-like [Cryptomeria japonica]GLJ07754.1 hypothetical protein SUGI_0073630 [Cryptomeria japonica]
MINSFVKPHVVAVPFPALGHTIPLLNFAISLASSGLAITCVTTAANAPRLKLRMAHAFSSGLDIRLLVLPTPLVEGLPEGVESFDQVLPEHCGLIYDLVVKLEQPFNHWLEAQIEGMDPPVCIMHDVLLGWTMEVPQEHNITRVVFNTYGAFALTLLRSAWLSSSHNALEKEGDTILLSLDLSTPLRLHKHEIDTMLFDPLMLEVIGRLKSLNQGGGMLINTYEQLEPEYLQHLGNLTGKKVWSIGPVLPSTCFGGVVKDSNRGKMVDISEDKLLQWLDSQSSCSVAYISFGSQIFLTEEQSKALASGLEASGQPFIWAIKVSPKFEPRTSDTADLLDRTYLPEGFQERTKNRGLVIWGWAPQLILSHPSVGAFVSHCGWNSMLESVALGVPLITWPIYADQHFNSKLAIKLGIGIQICQHRDGTLDKERVKDGVTLVLSKEEGKEMKRGAEKLKKMAREAVELG